MQIYELPYRTANKKKKKQTTKDSLFTARPIHSKQKSSRSDYSGDTLHDSTQISSVEFLSAHPCDSLLPHLRRLRRAYQDEEESFSTNPLRGK